MAVKLYCILDITETLHLWRKTAPSSGHVVVLHHQNYISKLLTVQEGGVTLTISKWSLYTYILWPFVYGLNLVGHTVICVCVYILVHLSLWGPNVLQKWGHSWKVRTFCPVFTRTVSGLLVLHPTLIYSVYKKLIGRFMFYIIKSR